MQCNDQVRSCRAVVHTMKLCTLFLFAVVLSGARAGTSVRLVGGTRVSEGRVELLHEGQWGTVCDDNFDENDAKVVCRILGYTGRVPLVRTLAYYGQGSGPIWLDDVTCTPGVETDILDCAHNGVGKHNCGHHEDVGVDCLPTTQIRLIGGGRNSAGRVEIKIGGRWGTVCDDSFDTNDARVVCRMLGYTRYTPTVQTGAYYGRGSDPIWLDDLACNGSQTDLLQCVSTDDIGKHNCDHSEDVGVDCLPYLRSDTLIRLVNGSRRSEGRVEVYNAREWGTVCDDAFDLNDAIVVCRMLGFTSDTPEYRYSAYYGQGSGTIWLDNVGCLGSESSIFYCRHNGLGVHDCQHYEDVGVDCRPARGPTRVTISGPADHVTDGTKPLGLTCTAENFTASLSFAWGGVHCASAITSAEYNTCIFTPSIAVDGRVVRCTANNHENKTLSTSALYTLNLKYPPASAPVMTGFAPGDSVLEGSNVTLICTVTGGKPIVSAVTIICQDQSVTSMEADMITRSTVTSVSNTITLANLQVEDDRTMCRCAGNWSTQPNMYSVQSSVTVRVLAALKPNVSSLTLNGKASSLTVSAADNTSVVLSCAASGRPSPSLSVVRVDTGQPLEADTSHISGQDEDVQQYTLTTSARCQDAAMYTCQASNRKGSDYQNITLFVNCAPEFEDELEIGTPDNPLILSAGEDNKTSNATLYLIVYPTPTLLHVDYLGPNISEDASKSAAGNIFFGFECTSAEFFYRHRCTITLALGDIPDAGYYRLTAGNLFGEIRFFVMLKIAEKAVPETEADDPGERTTTSFVVYIGAGAGGLVLVVLLVVLVMVIRRYNAGKQIYDRPQPKSALTDNPSYASLAMSNMAGKSPTQVPGEVYENVCFEPDAPVANPYVNFPAVTETDSKAKKDRKKGKAGKGRDEQGVAIKDTTMVADVVYENAILR